jgi:hypothetical protein
MGLTKEKLLKHDAFFFWQLLFPICDPAKSGIADDPRLAFYLVVEGWSQKYAASIGIGGVIRTCKQACYGFRFIAL